MRVLYGAVLEPPEMRAQSRVPRDAPTPGISMEAILRQFHLVCLGMTGRMPGPTELSTVSTLLLRIVLKYSRRGSRGTAWDCGEGRSTSP